MCPLIFIGGENLKFVFKDTTLEPAEPPAEVSRSLESGGGDREILTFKIVEE